MSKIVFVLSFVFLVITLAAAGGYNYNNDQYGQQYDGPSQYGQYGSGQYGGGHRGSGASYGRKRREIPAQQQQAAQPGQPQPQPQSTAQQGQQAQFEPVRGPKKFSFNVNDGIQGANQLRKEQWDNGTVTGMYANPLGNKKYQIINYIADDKGYRVLSTKVVDESELAQIGGQTKFSPQSGKSAQVDMHNDGNSASWTVTPDQINQMKQKTQPEGRSTKDASKNMDDDAQPDHGDMDMDMDNKKMNQDKHGADQQKNQGKRGRRAAMDMGMGHMGSGSMHGGMMGGSGGMMGHGGMGHMG